MAPTPTVQLAVEMYRAQGGIAVTASHNPAEWNGMKFIDATGAFLDHQQNAELRGVYDARAWTLQPFDKVGKYVQDKDFIYKHIERVFRIPEINISAIRAKEFKVVLDAVNASGSFVVRELLHRLNCEVVPLHCSGNGIFPHTPEPIPQNLGELGAAVRAHHADLGIAIDPDGDRLVLYTEEGEPYGEELTITTAVRAILEAGPKNGERHVVVNLSTTKAVEDIAHQHKAVFHRTPVGEINVVKKMRETKALIGGEGSGGVIVPSVHDGRDALAGLVLVLAAFADFHGTVSEYKATLPAYAIVKKKFTTEGLDTDALLTRAAKSYARHKPDTSDGVRIGFTDGWVHLRRSNTEPIIRVIAEALTPEAAEERAEQVIAKLLAPGSPGKD
jgi:phosphomannomutase